MGWYVYMLRCRDGSLYTGYTDDIDRRAAVHNAGKGGKYTRSRLPVQVVYRETCPDKSSALKREAAIKKLDGVNDCSVNFFAQKMILDADDARFEEIIKKAAAAIKKVDPDCRLIVK